MTMIKITEEQMQFIQEFMKKLNCTQEEAIEYLMLVGMKEMKFRTGNE